MCESASPLLLPFVAVFVVSHLYLVQNQLSNSLQLLAGYLFLIFRAPHATGLFLHRSDLCELKSPFTSVLRALD